MTDNAKPRYGRPPLDRLMDRRNVVDGCWVFEGARSGGYGSIRVAGKAVRAHRLSYELLVGPIPAGLDLDHLCRNRACFNPEHLEPVTAAENSRRGLAGQYGRAKTHCPHGHEYTDENTYLISGRRACVACRRIRQASYRKAAA